MLPGVYAKGSRSRDTRCKHTHRTRPPTPAMPTEAVANHFLASTIRYFWSAYSTMTGSYLAMATLLILVVLGYIIPDISNKIYASSELSDMKKVLNMMEHEVTRAEAACLTVADEICCLQSAMQDDTTETVNDMRDLSICTSCSVPTTQSEPVQVKQKVGFFRRMFFPQRNTSHKEIAIMSYLYTTSFDAKKDGDSKKLVASE